MNTKDQVRDYVQKETRAIREDDFSLLTTTVIARSLHLSRSLVSQYLNEWFKEGVFIKISSRPVYYFEKAEFERLYGLQGLEQEYFQMEEFLSALHAETENDVFQNAIGYEGSLDALLRQVKSALLYSDKGLPIALFGKRGSGKSFLVKLIHKFCIAHQLISEKQSLWCLKILEEEAYETILFGDETKAGILEQSEIGVLYLESASNLSQVVQYQLSNVIRDGYYYKGKKIVRVNCRLVFGLDVNPHDVFDYSLVQNLPIICQVPDFDKRGSEEKEKFILKFFKQEQKNLGIHIHLSPKLLEALLGQSFDEDIHEMEKCIKNICASALNRAKDGIMKCYIYHLPDKNFECSLLQERTTEETMIDIDTYVISESSIKIIQLFERIIETFHAFRTSTISHQEMFALFYEYMRNYYDLIIFDERYSQQKVGITSKIVDEILESKKSQNQINFPSNCGFVLSRMLLSSTKENSRIARWASEHTSEIKALLSFLEEEIHDIFVISGEISNLIYQTIELPLAEIELVFLMLNIYFYNDNVKNKEVAAIIVSHGYSTASSIADAANQLLKEHLFDSFDMPLDSSSEEIIAKVNHYILSNAHYKDLILLVDMGSLELIGERILGNIDVGVINNISTGIALHIGQMIEKKVPMEEILKSASLASKTTYKILNRAKKEKVIIFISDAGVSVAERMVNLFRHSLPKPIDLRFFSYDFKKLLTNGMEDPIFKKYEVLLMIKPHSLVLEQIKSVSLEDIVNFTDITVVDESLSGYLNQEEIEVFNHNLLKNFSLQNVMQNLTILNANKLLDFISDSLIRLEHKMNRKFQSKTTVGIYIHVCFLMERLVTKTAIESYENEKQFEEAHHSFVKDVNDSFGAMLAHYNVELPVSEIALLYDYIVNDRNRMKGGEDDF